MLGHGALGWVLVLLLVRMVMVLEVGNRWLGQALGCAVLAGQLRPVLMVLCRVSALVPDRRGLVLGLSCPVLANSMSGLVPGNMVLRLILSGLLPGPTVLRLVLSGLLSGHMWLISGSLKHLAVSTVWVTGGERAAGASSKGNIF